MIFNIFNLLFVLAAIEAHSIETYHTNFVCNHDQFNTHVMEQMIRDHFLKMTENSRRFKIRPNLTFEVFSDKLF